MEIIHFMQGDVVDVFFYVADREEVPANIQVHTTIGETWLVFYAYTGDWEFGIGCGSVSCLVFGVWCCLFICCWQ